MAADVIRTMASLGLTMLGSGTSSTRMSCVSNQQLAFIMSPFFSSARRPLPLAAPISLAGRGEAPAPACRGPCAGGDLAGFHHLLEAPQILRHLLVGIGAEELGDQRAEQAARRPVQQLDLHDGAAAARRALKAHRAPRLHVRALERSPRDQLVRLVV